MMGKVPRWYRTGETSKPPYGATRVTGWYWTE